MYDNDDPPDNQLKFEAVKQNGTAIHWINAYDVNSLDEKLQIEAYKQNKYSLKFIKNPCNKLLVLIKLKELKIK